MYWQYLFLLTENKISRLVSSKEFPMEAKYRALADNNKTGHNDATTEKRLTYQDHNQQAPKHHSTQICEAQTLNHQENSRRSINELDSQ